MEALTHFDGRLSRNIVGRTANGFRRQRVSATSVVRERSAVPKTIRTSPPSPNTTRLRCPHPSIVRIRTNAPLLHFAGSAAMPIHAQL